MKIYRFLILLLLSSLVSSCGKDESGFSPYTLSNYEAGDSVKTIKESIYSGRNRNKLESKNFYSFDEFGNLTSLLTVVGKDTVSQIHQYDERGRIVSVTQENTSDYVPVFGETGDLIRTTYTLSVGDNLLNCCQDFSYDKYGNVYEETGKANDVVVYQTSSLYEGNKLVRRVRRIDNKVEEYECDTMGLVISKTCTEDGKVTSQSSYSYVLDNRGNWIARDERVNNKLKASVLRDIEYYSVEDLSVGAVGGTKSFTHIGFIDDYVNEVLSRSGDQGNTPNKTLFIILVICTVILTIVGFIYFSWFLFYDFTGHVQKNGMKRLWMYNVEPYAKVGSMMLVALVAFIVSLILILLVGVVIWGLLWLVQILLWITIILGVLCLIGGVLALIGGEHIGCLPLVIGLVIVIFAKEIDSFGERLVTWGFEFMNNLNMFGWSVGIFRDYWDVLLVIFLTPIAIFLAFAFVVIALSMLLNGIEYVITRIYSIRRPCPVCGSTDTPDYIIGGKPHPVLLHPGVYGVFHHESPVTKEYVPTMLLNGRGKITRRCRKCNSYISADVDETFGTEIHIGIVGHRSSGKSYLLYSGLSALMSAYPERLSQIDADESTKIEYKKRRIDARNDIQTDVANKYRATQLMLRSKYRPVPYHLFFYDVAGEKFNSGSDSHKTAMDFYRNVQSVVFMVDPSMLDTTGTPASMKFVEWQKERGSHEKYKIDSSFAVLNDILETVGRNPAKIDMSIVCAKMDMGYFGALGYPANPSEQEIKSFMTNELGLGNFLNSADSFKSVRYYAVSAVDTDKTRLNDMFSALLEQRGVSL